MNRIPYSTRASKPSLPNLNQLKNVSINETKIADKHVLMYNSVENLWENTVLPVADSAVASPYYMKACLTSNNEIGVSSLNNLYVWGMQEQFEWTNPNFGDYNENNSRWECPQTAIYKLNAAVRIAGVGPSDILRKAFVKIVTITSGGGILRTLSQGGLDMHLDYDSEGHNWAVNCFSINEINAGEFIRIVVEYTVRGGYPVVLQGAPSHIGPQSTFLTIERM